MIREIELKYPARNIPSDLASEALMAAGISPGEGVAELIKRSIDARGKHVTLIYRFKVYTSPDYPDPALEPEWKNVANSPEVHIIGAGPAGLFAALRLIELGLKPVILERGKNIRDRRRDLVKITRHGKVDPDSNYCFGEGGAGTYSDGKLYTRSTKRGDVLGVLKMLVAHGAEPDILADAHPHVGTNKLPGIITAMRETIIHHGGEVLFNTKVKDIQVKNGAVSRIVTQNGESMAARFVILATGHSARDIFHLFYEKGWMIEAKPFAMGVRVEHHQDQINKMRYAKDFDVESLPPASYNLVHQAGDRGVYSFCMCPGGIIAPCATDYGEVVTNGWSPSKRNNPYANSGIVTEIKLTDLTDFKDKGPLAGLEFQAKLEKEAWIAGGRNLFAPAQRLADFVDGKSSTTLPDCSYNPGVTAAPLHDLLHGFIGKNLREGFKNFGKKMHGYLTNEAIVVGVESRTSSPVRIPRDRESFQHPEIKGLYPCGEGAGYAGGIVSAAIDGMKCSEKISETLNSGSRQ